MSEDRVEQLTDVEHDAKGGDSASKEGYKTEREIAVPEDLAPAASEPSAPLEDFDEKEYSDEEYARMLDLYDGTMRNFEEGQIVTGTVLAVGDSDVVVDIGFKSEGTIPLVEFGDGPEIHLGDQVEVYLETVEDQEGQIVLSKQKADFMRVWDKIKEAYDTGATVEGKLVRRIKGGIVVDLFAVDAFLPGSQIDIRQVKNFDQFIGEVFPFKIIKLNKSRRNIVVSRRAVLEEERDRKRRQILSELEVDQVREGAVKNITDFGAFIDLGGVDGLLHITDMSWGRVSHPSELVAIGDNIRVKVLNYEEERGRISLGLKQLTPHPWESIEDKYPAGAKVRGKVVSITDYGAFIELEEGVEGLVHISEMSWTRHVRHPSKIVAIGDIVDTVVLRVDPQGQKISLGFKQVEPDPWLTIDERHPVGTRIVGRVRNLTNFGAFVEVEEGIDGLVHISDMSWTRRIRHPNEIMKKGQAVDVVILEIDKDRRRISLGYKQIFENPWEDLAAQYAVGAEAQGTILRLLDRGVVVELDGDVEGFIPASQLGVPGLRRPTDHFSEGDRLPMKVIEIDTTQRKIVLSVREYLRGREREEIEEYRRSHQPKPVTVEEMVERPEEPTRPSETAETEAAPSKTEAQAPEAVEEAPEAPEAVEESTAVAAEAVEAAPVDVVEEAPEAPEAVEESTAVAAEAVEAAPVDVVEEAPEAVEETVEPSVSEVDQPAEDASESVSVEEEPSPSEVEKDVSEPTSDG